MMTFIWPIPWSASMICLLLRALEHDAEATEEALGLLRDLTDLVVADDGIEGVESVGRAMVQPIQLSQLAPLLVGDAARSVGLRRDQVEAVDVGHPSLLR